MLIASSTDTEGGASNNSIKKFKNYKASTFNVQLQPKKKSRKARNRNSEIGGNTIHTIQLNCVLGLTKKALSLYQKAQTQESYIKPEKQLIKELDMDIIAFCNEICLTQMKELKSDASESRIQNYLWRFWHVAACPKNANTIAVCKQSSSAILKFINNNINFIFKYSQCNAYAETLHNFIQLQYMPESRKETSRLNDRFVTFNHCVKEYIFDDEDYYSIFDYDSRIKYDSLELNDYVVDEHGLYYNDPIHYILSGTLDIASALFDAWQWCKAFMLDFDE